MTKGIDVSKHNGNQLDFAAIKEAGIDFVIIRAGYGRLLSQKDPCFDWNYDQAKKAGLHVGAYWYSYATTEEQAREEARCFIAVIRNKTFDMPVYYDIEEGKQFRLGKEKVGKLVTSFNSVMEEAGYYAGLYCSTYWLTNYVPLDVRKRYTVWVAQYANKCTYAGPYDMWQRSARYTIHGSGGNKWFDLDECYKNFPEIIKTGGFNGYPKPVTGDVNGDGKVTSADARQALRQAAKLELESKKADVDGDGKVTSKDAKKILKKAAKTNE